MTDQFDFNPEEALAKLAADMDQVVSGMGELSRVLGVYRDGLVNNGFFRKEAIAICIAWQQSMFSSGDEDA